MCTIWRGNVLFLWLLLWLKSTFFFTFLSFLYRATQFHIKIKFILALEANSAASLYCTFFQVLPLYADWTSDAYCYPSRILHSIDLPWIVFIRCTYFQVQNLSRVCIYRLLLWSKIVFFSPQWSSLKFSKVSWLELISRIHT